MLTNWASINKHRVALISTSLVSFEYLYILINLPFFFFYKLPIHISSFLKELGFLAMAVTLVSWHSHHCSFLPHWVGLTCVINEDISVWILRLGYKRYCGFCLTPLDDLCWEKPIVMSWRHSRILTERSIKWETATRQHQLVSYLASEWVMFKVGSQIQSSL